MNEGMAARSALLDVLGEDDGVTVDYIIGLITGDDGDVDIDSAVELLGAHADDFSEEALRAVVLQAASLVEADRVIGGVAAVTLDDAEPRVVASTEPRIAAPPPAAGPAPPASRTDSAAGSSSDLASKQSSVPDAVASLMELVPDASAALCEYVLRKSAWEVADALELLLGKDLESLEAEAARAAEAAARAREARELADRRAEKQARRAILERNDKVRDYAADGVEPKLSAPRLPYSGTRKEALRGSGARFLDGQVVATKGEKHIVVNAKPEWDGGSTGKVYTKGKRGKGYV